MSADDPFTRDPASAGASRRAVLKSAMAIRQCMLVAAVAITASIAAHAQTVIPTRYVADRFYAAPVTLQGDTLMMLMDTGGGQVFVSKRALLRMGITPKFIAIAEGDSIWDGGTFPTFKPGLG